MYCTVVASLGINTETVTSGGWILNTDAVTAILPQVIAYCASLLAEAPVVIYCLDNSSFCNANADGQLSAIIKQKDGVFHVVGEIVVVHDITLAAAVTNLKRIILAWGDRRIIIITPGPRYLSQPCSCSNEHCTHLLIPESGLKMMSDLSRLHLFIQRRLSSSPNVVVVPAGELLVGKKAASRRKRFFLMGHGAWHHRLIHEDGAHPSRLPLHQDAAGDTCGPATSPTASEETEGRVHLFL
jgi:hypothetical protein